jgi:molybdenum cofactor guanylyltransferase
MPQASGIVLAGGASLRMGRDKRALVVDGEPMLRRVARVVAAASDELIVVVAPNRPLPDGILGGLAAHLVVDRRTEVGPLAGVEAGLGAAVDELAIVVAADMPWLETSLLRLLVRQLADGSADAVAVATDRGPEPLLAAYRREPALEAATRLLDAGERRLGDLLGALKVESVADPTGRAARNVNELADLVAPHR